MSAHECIWPHCECEMRFPCPRKSPRRAFPDIRVRYVRNRVGVTISGTEYSLTLADAVYLQDEIRAYLAGERE